MVAHADPQFASSKPSTRATRWVHDPRVPGVLVFIQAAQFMTVIMLAASMAPGYDVGGGAISDLGVIPETAALFNVSLILTGVLNLAVGSLQRKIRRHVPDLEVGRHRRRWRWRLRGILSRGLTLR